jgi:hypothetical protein
MTDGTGYPAGTVAGGSTGSTDGGPDIATGMSDPPPPPPLRHAANPNAIISATKALIETSAGLLHLDFVIGNLFLLRERSKQNAKPSHEKNWKSESEIACRQRTPPYSFENSVPSLTQSASYIRAIFAPYFDCAIVLL